MVEPVIVKYTAQFFSRPSPNLCNLQKHKISGMLTEQELPQALKSMPSENRPGSDGFTVELYKVL